MITLAPGTKVYLACRPVDLRNGFDGLAAKAQQMIGVDPFSGHQRWLGLFEQRFAFYKWKLCRVDRPYAGIGALRKEGVARLERGPDPGSRVFQAAASSGAWVK